MTPLRRAQPRLRFHPEGCLGSGFNVELQSRMGGNASLSPTREADVRSRYLFEATLRTHP